MTGFFKTQRPKGFRHSYIYYDEHRQVVEDAERRARESSAGGSVSQEAESRGAIHAAFKSSLQRRRRVGMAAWKMTGHMGCLLLLLLIISVLYVLFG